MTKKSSLIHADDGFSIQELLDHNRIDRERIGIDSEEKYIDLNSLKINSLEGLQNIPSIKEVETLCLNSNSLAIIAPGALNGLSNLGELELGNNRLTTLNAQTFDGLTKLHWIDLSNNELTTLDPHVFSNLINLGRLNLSSNQLSFLDPKIFTGPSHLYTLSLSNNRFTTIEPEIFGSLVHLTDLLLYGEALTQKNIKQIKQVLHVRPMECGCDSIKMDV